MTRDTRVDPPTKEQLEKAQQRERGEEHALADRLIPATELPALFHRSLRTVRKWIAEGAIPTVKVGGTVYMRQSDLDATLASSRRIAARMAAREVAGSPTLSDAQLVLVRRAFDDAFAKLDAQRYTQNVDSVA